VLGITASATSERLSATHRRGDVLHRAGEHPVGEGVDAHLHGLVPAHAGERSCGTWISMRSGSVRTSVRMARCGETYSPTLHIRSATSPAKGARTTESATARWPAESHLPRLLVAVVRPADAVERRAVLLAAAVACDRRALVVGVGHRAATGEAARPAAGRLRPCRAAPRRRAPRRSLGAKGACALVEPEAGPRLGDGRLGAHGLRAVVGVAHAQEGLALGDALARARSSRLPSPDPDDGGEGRLLVGHQRARGRQRVGELPCGRRDGRDAHRAATRAR
jgi:hypothetical protein